MVITHSLWINNNELALYPVLVEVMEVTTSVSYISIIFENCFKDSIQFQMHSIEKRSYLLYIQKFSRGLYFRETSHMRSFVKIKPSRNGKITL